MSKKSNRMLISVFGITCLTVVIGLAVSVADGLGTTEQTVPMLIPYEGRVELGGIAVNEPIVMKFSLFTSENSEAEPIWGPETHGLTLVDGRFSVMLGETVPLHPEDFAGGDVWVGVSVQAVGSSEPVALTGRQRLASVAFALQALRASVADKAVHADISVRAQIAETATGQLATQVAPPGMVAPFDLEACPAGWSEYVPARGLFVRGIDPTGSTKYDPAGKRKAGNYQPDMLGSHSHTVRRIPPGVGGDGGKTSLNGDDLDPRASKWPGPINATGGPETRPKNVALLFCRKD